MYSDYFNPLYNNGILHEYGANKETEIQLIKEKQKNNKFMLNVKNELIKKYKIYYISNL